jgi:hypothetical protein
MNIGDRSVLRAHFKILNNLAPLKSPLCTAENFIFLIYPPEIRSTIMQRLQGVTAPQSEVDALEELAAFEAFNLPAGVSTALCSNFVCSSLFR